MTETVVVRGEGGALFEMDVPTGGHQLELWNDKLAKKELVIVTDPVEWVERAGAKVLVLVETPDEVVDEPEVAPADEPKRRGGRSPKNTAAAPAETPTEGDPSEE